MRIRAFTTTLPAALQTALPACLAATVAAVVLLAAPTTGAAAGAHPIGSTSVATTPADDDVTQPTINEFLPEQRPLSDCLGALPKPNCGSEARGGWRQTTVFLAIVAGLAFIAWRVVAASRRARRSADRPVTPGRPDATTARDDDGGVRAP